MAEEEVEKPFNSIDGLYVQDKVQGLLSHRETFIGSFGRV